VSAGPELIGARRAVAFLFFTMGLLFGTWVAHIPSVQSRFGLSEARLGTLLLLNAAGAVAAMLLSGALIQRFGSHRLGAVCCALAAALLPFAFLAPSVASLGVALFAFGAAGGALDVSMNDQAVLVERHWGRPIMSSFHALFSVGGLTGAAVGAAVLRWGGTPLQQATLSALVVVAVDAWLSRDLLEDGTPSGASLLGLAADRRLAGLCALIFLCFMSEGVVADWSALYMRDHVGTSDSTAPLAFAAFSLTMTAGRFLGDAVVARLGQRVTATGGGLLAASGTALALGVPGAAAGIAGFALVGAGLANLVPMIFTKAGNIPGLASSAGLATVSVAGYGALLAGPPLVGYLAELTSLPAALRLLVLSGLVVAVAAPAFVPLRARD
jgi:fucose permease